MSGTTATIGADIINASNGNDGIVIEKSLSELAGGRTLDCTGITADVLNAGHIIVKTSAGVYKPLGVTDEGAYSAIGSGETAVGVLKASILVSQPLASIMTIGQVNKTACPYPVTSAIETALPHILFI